MDPDSYLYNHGRDAFAAYIASERSSFISFKRRLLEKKFGSTPQAEAEAIKDLLLSIQLVPDELAQYTLIKASSKELKIPEELLHQRFAQLHSTSSSKSPRSDSVKSPVPSPSQQALHQQEGEILKMLLIYGPSFDFLGPYVLREIEELSFSHPTYATLHSALEVTQKEDKNIAYSTLFSHHDAEVKATAHALLPQHMPPNIPSEKEMQSLAQQGVIRLKRAYIGHKIHENVRALEQLSSTTSTAEEEQLLTAHKKLKHLYKHLSQLLESVIFIRDTS